MLVFPEPPMIGSDLLVDPDWNHRPERSLRLRAVERLFWPSHARTCPKNGAVRGYGRLGFVIESILVVWVIGYPLYPLTQS